MEFLDERLMLSEEGPEVVLVHAGELAVGFANDGGAGLRLVDKRQVAEVVTLLEFLEQLGSEERSIFVRGRLVLDDSEGRYLGLLHEHLRLLVFGDVEDDVDAALEEQVESLAMLAFADNSFAAAAEREIEILGELLELLGALFEGHVATVVKFVEDRENGLFLFR